LVSFSKDGLTVCCPEQGTITRTQGTRHPRDTQDLPRITVRGAHLPSDTEFAGDSIADTGRRIFHSNSIRH